MNAEQWLYRGHRIYEEIEWLKQEIEIIGEKVHSASAHYSSVKVQASSVNATENLKIKYINLRDQYKSSLAELDRINAEIEGVISQIPESALRIILRSKILKGNRWDTVADEVHYSTRQTKRLYIKALSYVETILKKQITGIN